VNDPILWEDEYVYVQSLIAQDCFNNSAWNQKWFVCHRGMHHVPLTPTVAQQEIDETLDCAAIDPTNESPWRYLIGIVKEQGKKLPKDEMNHMLESCRAKTREMQRVLIDSGFEALSFVHMTCALMDIMELNGEDRDWIEAAELAHSLGTLYDTIRQKYWLQREEHCRNKVSSSV